MAVDAGTVVRGRVWATRSGRRPLARVAALMAPQAPERRLGQALPAPAGHDATGGRGRDRLDDRGTMKLVTACAVRAGPRVGWERRSVHVETTSRSGGGEAQWAAAPDVPCRGPSGESQAKRPARPQVVRSRRGVDRAGPIGGTPADGHAADPTRQTTRVSESAPLLAHHGVHPGAERYMADAARGTADQLAARGESVFSTRLPATDSACEGGLAAAVAPNRWEEGGGLAQTPPPMHRPRPFDHGAAGRVSGSGQADRAVVGHARAPDQRHQPRVARDLEASWRTRATPVGAAAPQASCCQAAAAATAATRRARPRADHPVAVVVAARPPYGPGRPRHQPPRVITALR
jgi:hypothetical protein